MCLRANLRNRSSASLSYEVKRLNAISVVGRLLDGPCVCFSVQTGKHLLGLNLSAFVQGFGCRPMEMVQLAPGPASESRQRTNPRVMCAEGAALDYGDFAAGSGLLRLD